MNPPQPTEPNPTEETCEHGFIIGQCLACYLSEYGPGRPSRREIAVQFALKLLETYDPTADFISEHPSGDSMARNAVQLTDALLAELEKGRSK